MEIFAHVFKDIYGSAICGSEQLEASEMLTSSRECAGGY